jgi:hypothetical protein
VQHFHGEKELFGSKHTDIIELEVINGASLILPRACYPRTPSPASPNGCPMTEAAVH